MHLPGCTGVAPVPALTKSPNPQDWQGPQADRPECAVALRRHYPPARGRALRPGPGPVAPPCGQNFSHPSSAQRRVQALLPRLQVVAGLMGLGDRKPAGRWLGNTAVLMGRTRKQKGGSPLHCLDPQDEGEQNRMGEFPILPEGLDLGVASPSRSRVHRAQAWAHRLPPSERPGLAPGGVVLR